MTGNNVPFIAPAPEDLQAAANSYLEIRLTATDGGGLSATVSRDFRPRKVDVTLATDPPGLTITVNTINNMTGPTTFVSWDNYGLGVQAASQVGPANVFYTFGSWSDGGAASHTIVTPAAAATFTATFDPVAVSAGDVSVIEGDAGSVTAQVPITLSVSSPQTVTVGWSTADGTASAAAGDYMPASGTVTFPPGSTSRTVPVTVMGDLNGELDEIVLVELDSPAAAVIGDGTGEAMIENDDPLATPAPESELAHGSRVRGALPTLPGPIEQVDWYRISQRPRSSYEVVLDAGSGDLVPVSLSRVAADGSTVRQNSAPSGLGHARSLRWQNTSSSSQDTEFVRVQSGQCSTSCGPDDVYHLRAYETTYSVPRFSNTGQATILILQNTRNTTVAGRIFFWSPTGALLGNSSFSLSGRRTLVLNTATVAGVANVAGSITVTNDAPYGTLAGKAVAMDSAGFTFDTPMVPRPR